jgi:hypothetical protein
MLRPGLQGAALGHEPRHCARVVDLGRRVEHGEAVGVGDSNVEASLDQGGHQRERRLRHHSHEERVHASVVVAPSHRENDLAVRPEGPGNGRWIPTPRRAEERLAKGAEPTEWCLRESVAVRFVHGQRQALVPHVHSQEPVEDLDDPCAGAQLRVTGDAESLEHDDVAGGGRGVDVSGGAAVEPFPWTRASPRGLRHDFRAAPGAAQLPVGSPRPAGAVLRPFPAGVNGARSSHASRRRLSRAQLAVA